MTQTARKSRVAKPEKALASESQPTAVPRLGVHWFGVRHHSPRSTAVLLRLLESVRPEVVLVEAPSDCNHLIEALTDKGTEPPVAILAYRSEGDATGRGGSSLWPFASYSPEYAALRWARDHGATAKFIDISSGQALMASRDEHAADEEAAEREEASADQADAADEPDATAETNPFDELAREHGLRTFDEFWEAWFEAPEFDVAQFQTAMMAFCTATESFGSEGMRKRSQARDAFMLDQIERAIASGVAAEKIVVVLGAAHVARLAIGNVDRALLVAVEPSCATNVTVIPYSYPRLAEQLGYGAGNRAPMFYQRAHAAGANFERAALEVLVEFGDSMRLRGYAVSLADTIEAYRLAKGLTALRNKTCPGLDEVREAAIATMGRGEAGHIDQLLWPAVVGRNIGKVAASVGKNSLQEEFWQAVANWRLPKTDEPEQVSLRLADEVHVAMSVFLHRLRVIGVPYAALAGAKRTRNADNLEALARVRESWECQWTPSTELGLIEAIVRGETIAAAAERTLRLAIEQATTTDQSSALLVDAVITNSREAIVFALAACERLNALEQDLGSLAGAARALAGLVTYGSTRKQLGLDDDVLEPLLQKTFARVLLRLEDAVRCGDDDVARVCEALRVLHELFATAGRADEPAWLAALGRLPFDFSAHATACGVATGLLALSRKIGELELQTCFLQRLDSVSGSQQAAQFLIGFLEVNPLAIVKQPEIVATINTFVVGLEPQAFRDALPALRGAFSSLGKTEIRYLVENVVSVNGYSEQQAASAAATVISAKDQEQLKAASAEIAKAMDDLDDLL